MINCLAEIEVIKRKRERIVFEFGEVEQVIYQVLHHSLGEDLVLEDRLNLSLKNLGLLEARGCERLLELADLLELALHGFDALLGLQCGPDNIPQGVLYLLRQYMDIFGLTDSCHSVDLSPLLLVAEHILNKSLRLLVFPVDHLLLHQGL